MRLTTIECDDGIENILTTNLTTQVLFRVLLSSRHLLPLLDDRGPIEMKTLPVFICQRVPYFLQVEVDVVAGSISKAISKRIANLLLVGSRRNVFEIVWKDHEKPSFLHRLVRAPRELYGSNVLSEAPWIIQ